MTRFAIIGSLVILAGCAKSESPSGPGGSVPPFTVWLSESAITPPQNAQVKLVVAFPNEFNDLDGQRVYFGSSSDGGSFNSGADSSHVDIQAPDGGNLTPSMWYGYNGSLHEFTDTVKVTVVNIYGTTLAWNYGLILVH